MGDCGRGGDVVPNQTIQTMTWLWLIPFLLVFVPAGWIIGLVDSGLNGWPQHPWSVLATAGVISAVVTFGLMAVVGVVRITFWG